MAPRAVLWKGAALSLLVLTACGDVTEPEPGPPGSLSFTYAGEGFSGTFQAEGGADPNLVVYGTWAAAVRNETRTELSLVAMQAVEEPFSHVLGLFLDGVSAPGTFQLGCPDESAACHEGEFTMFFDFRSLFADPDAFPPGEYYEFESGSVTIETWAQGRIQGTFQGLVSTSEEEDMRRTVTISGGTFDLPVLDRGQ